MREVTQAGPLHVHGVKIAFRAKARYAFFGDDKTLGVSTDAQWGSCCLVYRSPLSALQHFNVFTSEQGDQSHEG